MYKKYYILFVFCCCFASAQDIEVIKVMYENNLNYINLYNKKTVNNDEIDTSQNISLITNSLNLDGLSKCGNSRCYSISANDILVSNDFILPSSLNIKDKLSNVESYMKGYLNKLFINQKILKKKSNYILYQNELKNVIVVVLKMSKTYYNTHTSNLKLCEDSNDEVVVYRFLNGNDEYEIENKSL